MSELPARRLVPLDLLEELGQRLRGVQDKLYQSGEPGDPWPEAAWGTWS